MLECEKMAHSLDKKNIPVYDSGTMSQKKKYFFHTH